jgi:hypothetical protein
MHLGHWRRIVVLMGVPQAEQVRMVADLATPGEVRGGFFLAFMSCVPCGGGFSAGGADEQFPVARREVVEEFLDVPPPS